MPIITNQIVYNSANAVHQGHRKTEKKSQIVDSVLQHNV